MKVLVIGSGGREHALVWKIAQSPLVEKIYAAPGNAGIAEHAECLPVAAEDIGSLCTLALEKRIDLTVVGPEAPLVSGIVDQFRSKRLLIFGFDRDGARLEGSKVWAKEFMRRHRIPTGNFRVFDEAAASLDAVRSAAPPVVIKADGLAAGKGVVIANTREEAALTVESMMTERAFGSAGEKIIIEQFLAGDEVSVLALTDGKDYRLFVPSQDHKRAFDGDTGPNTGGMGAYAPVPSYGAGLADRVRREIIEPTFEGMKREGIAAAGVLYFGLIITGDGPKVLEYNCRFGDPETQAILPIFAGDLAETMLEAARGNLRRVSFENSGDAGVCVVIASGGYPGSYRKGYRIEGIEEARSRGCIVFHAGTVLKDGAVETSGGRVLGVTATAPSLRAALARAYEGAEAIRFTDCFYRRDIGKKGLRT
jgi:phosphoribosylamine--glycine ligase